jgi:hypothetical protein
MLTILSTTIENVIMESIHTLAGIDRHINETYPAKNGFSRAETDNKCFEDE